MKTSKHQKELREKYKVKKIRPNKRDNVSMSVDCDANFENIKNRFACMLYTPHMGNTMEHFHIRFTDKQAVKLRDWLNEFLKMKGIK